MTEGREATCDLHPEGSDFCTTCRFGLQAGREASAWPRVLDNEKACGAPKNARWGYLPCGCVHNGYGGHTYDRVPSAPARQASPETVGPPL